MSFALINWTTLELLKKLHTWDEIVELLKGQTEKGNWIVIPAHGERPFEGSAKDGERGVQRAGRFFLN